MTKKREKADIEIFLPMITENKSMFSISVCEVSECFENSDKSGLLEQILAIILGLGMSVEL